MAKILRVQSDQPAHVQRVDLDGSVYEIRLVWRDRLRGWYLSIDDSSGNSLVRNRRITPQSLPLAGVFVPDGPPGEFLVRGSVGYRRESLGSSVEVIYLSEDDISNVEPTPLVVRRP